MPEKKRILLIDNQKSQYQKIAGLLTGYEIFPGDEYDEFLNLVRIWVTVTYKQERQKLVIKMIIKKIEEWGIDLFILDYKIAGNIGGSTGIFLGQRLAAEFSSVPIIYLSRTPYNSKELGDEKYHVKAEQWVEKGYTGLNILDEPYFELNVRKKIRQMLLTDEDNLAAYQGKLKDLKEMELFKSTLWKYFRIIVETVPPGEKEIKVVDELHALVLTKEGTDDNLRKLLMEYIKNKNG
jgi:hypothetical protein